MISLVPGTAHAKTITETIDDTGDGGGNLLDGPQGIAVEGSGNVYRFDVATGDEGSETTLFFFYPWS
ncbi:MAG: hypothetical protein IIA41_02295 [SAR324 cluster bacterium]|nr:hypothetical protein [SAR324 cluster bacterium]